MPEIELSEDEAERLNKILKQNAEATGWTDALRWTDQAASKIDRLRKSINKQID